MITDYINPVAFFVSLTIGLLYTYFTLPEPDYIIKYPTPFNAGKVVYTDSNGTCYRYAIESVDCTSNKKIRIFKPQN